VWEELPPSGTFGGRINREFIFGGSKSFRDSSSIFTVTPYRSHGVFDKAGLEVEVDGDFHDLQKEEDERREKVLSALGLRIAVSGLWE
jgi:hypothetical protein